MYNLHENDVRFVFSLQLLVGDPMSYLLYLCLLAYSGVHHILRCVLLLLFFFVFFLRLVYPMLLVSLDFPLLIAPWILSNVYLCKILMGLFSYLDTFYCMSAIYVVCHMVPLYFLIST